MRRFDSIRSELIWADSVKDGGERELTRKQKVPFLGSAR